MTKDIFALTFNEFSRWTYEEYYANFIERLPHRLLQSAVSVNPDLPGCRGFVELKDLFSLVRGRRWKNPELYPYLNSLNTPNCTSLQSSLDALRIHVGLEELSSSTTPARRFWRLRDPLEGIFEITDGAVRKVEGLSMSQRESEPFPVVYSPHPHLFDDLQRSYYRGEGYNDEAERLWSLANEAVQAVNRYSSDIASGFCREIATVGFMARQPGEAKSFSMRNFYIGGIFVSIAGTISVAEQFIHEYYHQCIWPWWMLEVPSDLPSDEHTIISPVTGQRRRVSVMIHALLIYSSLINYYRFVLSPPESNAFDVEEVSAAQTRLAKIEQGFEPLERALKSALSECPLSRAMVEFVASTIER